MSDSGYVLVQCIGKLNTILIYIAIRYVHKDDIKP